MNREQTIMSTANLLDDGTLFDLLAFECGNQQG
jgi:hypothetical protein